MLVFMEDTLSQREARMLENRREGSMLVERDSIWALIDCFSRADVRKGREKHDPRQDMPLGRLDFHLLPVQRTKGL